MNHATIPAIPLIIPILLFLLDAVMIITVIFVDNKKAVNTLAWVTTILLLPVIGIVFYFIFGSKMRFKKEKAFKAKKIEDETIYHSFIHQLFHLEKETIIFNDPDIKNYQDMIRMNLTYGKSIYTQDNKIEIFTKGEDKFRSLFEDIKNASSSIHMTYYIFRHDTLGEELIRILTEKALQGVEVRLIYDDVGCKLTRKKIFQPLLKAGGQVYSFLPSILLFNLR
ncbi:MAG: PLDc N-terminal domain-containing protein, partial [Clostridiales bacterium]